MNLYLSDNLNESMGYTVENLLEYREFLQNRIDTYDFKYQPDLHTKYKAELVLCNEHITHWRGTQQDFIYYMSTNPEAERMLNRPPASYEGWWNQITMKGYYLSHKGK